MKMLERQERLQKRKRTWKRHNRLNENRKREKKYVTYSFVNVHAFTEFVYNVNFLFILKILHLNRKSRHWRIREMRKDRRKWRSNKRS